MIAARFFIRIRGNVQGPFDEEQLQSLVRRGQFSRIHEISEDGRNWVRADEYPQLFVSVTPAASWSHEPAEHTASAEPAELKEDVRPRMPSQDWFYIEDGEQRGPVQVEEIRLQLETGALTPEHLVWKAGMADWVPVRTIEAFKPPVAARPVERQRRRMSMMAVFSFVAALVWLGGVGSLLAIIFGGLAIQQIRDSAGRLSGIGLAAAGLVIGVCSLIVTVIVAVSVIAMMM